MDIVNTFIERHEQKVIEMFKKQRGIKPFVTFLCKQETDKVGEVMVLDIPEQLIFDKGKDFVRGVMIESIKKKLREENKNLVCVNWNSEGWMYKGSKEDHLRVNGDYRKLPKTEVLFMTFDSSEGTRTITYEIKRDLFVNEKGLNEEVEVELMKFGDDVELGGRFSKLFD